MKLLRLQLAAFGPYAGQQEIDFRLLAERTLFLVHGPTGSGKSTLLDALCYALFGETSGADRDAAAMRSHHADAALPTSLCLEFRLGESVYRVQRSPEQSRPKKVGEGTTVEKSKALLHRLDNTADADNADHEGKLLAEGWQKVSEAVQGLLGYSVSEFRQIVLLPQGGFQKFLRAESKEREEILETLFSTVRYRRLEVLLREQSTELGNALKKSRDQRAALLEQEGIGDVDALDKLCQQRAAAAEVALGAASAATAVAKQAAVLFEAALKTNQLLNERVGADAAHAKLQQQVEAKQLDRQRLAAMRSAIAVRPLMATRDECSQRLATCVTSLEQARRGAEQATAEQEQALVSFAAAEQAAQQIDDLQREAQRLEALRKAAAELDEQQRKFAALEIAVADAQGATGRIEQALSGLEGKATVLRRELEQCRALVAEAGDRKLAAREAEQNIERRGRLEAQRSGRLQSSIARGGLLKQKEDAEAKWRELGEHLEQLESDWQRGQAASLAAALEPGVACPVCGSADHPAPAKSDAALVDERGVKAARGAVENARGVVEGFVQKLAKADADDAAAKEKLENLEKELGEFCHSERAQLEAIHEAALKRLAEVGHADVKSRELVAKLEVTESNWAEERGAALENRDRLAAAKGELGPVGSRVQALQAEFGEHPSELAVLEKLHSEAVATVEQRKTSLEQARQRQEQAKTATSRLTAQLESSQDNHKQAVAALERAQQAFATALADNSFQDEAALRNALVSGAEIDALEAALSRFDQDLASAKDRRQRAVQAAADLEAVAVEPLQQAAEAAEAERAAAEKTAGAAASELEGTRKLLARVKKFEERAALQEQEYAVVGRVAEVARGRGANKRGIPFQRFVLASLLDDVLRVASVRLAMMSNGRYALRRSLDRGSKVTTTGLDLVVDDSFTGFERPVSTLSGGESFLASLSLALGLGDVVQSYAGGIRLETLLVDEGFGTLDQEALDLAMKALTSLQEGGRLIGVISHVSELRERITTRLEIRVSDQGSSAHFELG